MILNFIKVGPSEWSAWHRGVHYIVTQRGDKWILATGSSGTAANVVDRFDSEASAKATAHAMATPGRTVRSSVGVIDRRKAFGDATKATMPMTAWMGHVLDLAHVSEREMERYVTRARVQSWYSAGEAVWMAADALKRFVENGKREAKAQGELDFLRKAATKGAR